MSKTKELEQKVMGFMSNSEDRYTKHLIVELIAELRRRDREIEDLKAEKRVVREVVVEPVEYNFGPGGA